MGQWQSQPVCTSPACVQAASSILRNLAPDWQQMDPCTEFDKMVCSGFSEHNDDDQNSIATIQSRTNRILRKILASSGHEEAAGIRSTMLRTRSNAVDEHNFDMLRTNFDACMNTSAIQAAGFGPLTDLVISINQTWTVPLNDLETKVAASEYDGLAKAALFLEQHEIHTLCTIDSDLPVLPDPLNSQVNRFTIELPVPAEKDRSIYFDDEKLETYVAAMAKAFSKTFPDIDNTTAAGLAEAVAGFEVDLAKTLVQHDKTVTPYNKLDFMKNATVAEITAAAPALGFDTLIRGLSPAGHAPSSVLLEDMEPSLWPNISRIVTSHPRAAVQGFMIWKALAATGRFVDDKDLGVILGAYPDSMSRSDVCLETAIPMVSHLLEHYFVAATYPDTALRAAEKMTTNIRTQFKKRISGLDWMSDAAKKRAAKKVDNLRQNVGYSRANPDVRSAESLAAYYEGLNLTTSFFDNIMAGRRHKTAKTYAALAKPVDRDEFVGPSITLANALYNPAANSMVINAGVSQLPIFHPDLPQYASYGGLGVIVGHELTHGFDSNGYKYDENAELRAWWDNATIANYKTRTDCFADQFSQYTIDGPSGKVPVDGNLTLAENLADAGGLRVAYEAWAAERAAMPDSFDQSLPGLDGFTHEQLFFVFFGNSWCTSKTPATNARQAATDIHAPDRVRVFGTVANSRAFKDAFKCKAREPVCEAF